MPHFKVNTDELKILAETYNAEGRKAVYEILQLKYEIKFPNTVIRRMKNIESFHYDSTLDQFLFHQEVASNDIFLSMDELCTPMVQKRATVGEVEHSSDKPQAMERLIQELIGDRLLEMSKYVIIDSLSKKMIIEKTSLMTDGYQVIIH